MTHTKDLMTTKELAQALKKSRSYVQAMKRRGFQMPGGVATVDEAREWLRSHPEPRSRNTAEQYGTRRNI